MTSLLLLGFAALVAVVSSRVLPSAGWVYRSPRLGLAAWYAALSAMAGAVVAAVLVMVVRWPQTWAAACTWWTWGARVLLGDFGLAARVAAAVLLVLLAVLLGRVGWSVVRTVRATASRRRGHRALLAVACRYRPELGVFVVEHDRPAAYVVGGRADRVVVTSAAVEQLPPAQLAAVIAHERAHAAGRHQVLVDAVRLLALLAPSAVVLARAGKQVSRLVEIRADEVAAAEYGRLELARALVACAEAGRPEPRLVGVLAATGGDALERLNRLLTPPRPLSRPMVVTGSAGLLLVVAMPVLIVASSAVLPVLRACLGISC
ncbi:M56 family metallopeptidase [Fodinicola feengrottensis]|uniref:M56 family metallopeptidase n=1 Tax=Fodinicola feengrottensis TaxID=435914 RepID=A0ABN2J986_9ACTN